ncbi:hemerythrin domain-containing protein [Nocardia sp. ET3-3]|uniref:Hemerythrin domain-containing protein n=2 Tax=Nocardia terrae TaxID=2675851 RepID=A0A7K1V7D1_9NOCA|nr:hemerythrin domain-containing protein [Nocardia terrae]
MCHYCGCRDMPLIKEFIAEHEAVYNLSGDIRRALESGDIDTARRDLVEIQRQLTEHWAGEEQGLFAVMRDDPDCTDYIDALEAEHREMTTDLSTADLTTPEGRQQVLASLATLWPHIEKEEDGLFPMSLTTLSGEQWTAAIDAWERVHRRPVRR